MFRSLQQLSDLLQLSRISVNWAIGLDRATIERESKRITDERMITSIEIKE
jgi:hypothetical protein